MDNDKNNTRDESGDQPQTPQALTHADKKPAADSQAGLTWHLGLAIIAGALGSSFQHGYNTGVVNSPQKLIMQWINDTIHEKENVEPLEARLTMIWSILVAIFCVGGMLGGALVGTVADTFGRKGGLMLNNVLVVLTVIFEGIAKPMSSYYCIIIGRFLIGVNSGLNAGLSTMYLAEISPTHLRGAVGTVYQLIITISILVAQILGMSNLLGQENYWPILLCITIIPAIFQVLVLPFCPESPKYLLLSKGRDMDAQRALAWLRGTLEVHNEMDEMRSEYESVKLVPKVTLRELFLNPALRIPLFISLMIMLAQQFSGINAVMFFSTRIFEMASLDESRAQQATLAVGAMNVFMTFVSLVMVEKAGRKTLLLIGFGGMIFDTFLLGVCLLYADQSAAVAYMSILLVVIYVVLFATGPGSIPWFLVSELFNQSARPAATSIAICVNWTANFIVSVGFLPLQVAMGPSVFFLFAIIQLLFTVFIFFKVPETKNKSIEEISSMFRQRSYQ